MDTDKRQLKGAPARDAFKNWHKSLPEWMYACDIDFVLINKAHRKASIVAFLDYKKLDEGITFSECVAYNELHEKGYPVFIIESEPSWTDDQKPYFDDTSKFTIYRYLGGDWKPDPPLVELGFVARDLTAHEFAEWEGMLRHHGEVVAAKWVVEKRQGK